MGNHVINLDMEKGGGGTILFPVSTRAGKEVRAFIFPKSLVQGDRPLS